ncbi:MAG: hypothetical protein ACTHJN_15445 [Ginsengibacter sp.]
MQLFDKGFDKVVKSIFCSGKTTYEYAYKNFLPQIDKYYAQRKKVDEKFYQKLERDIVVGCVMPPITIAIVMNSIQEYIDKPKEDIVTLLEEQKENLYILDGIQRLNTLKRAYKEEIKDFDIYINLLISDSDDRLLYRMITLNNGQKPMSARHQIEVLAHNIFDFDNLPIQVQTEKARSKKRIKGSFDKDDIIKGYISYLSESVNIDNQKIIESKMDELIADKIIESNVTQTDSQFSKVIDKIEVFIEDEYLLKWFKQPNNLIGFCAGIGKSYSAIKDETREAFREMIENFELSFQSFDISKIKLGHLRRLTVQYFISKYEAMKSISQPEIEDSLSQASMLYM